MLFTQSLMKSPRQWGHDRGAGGGKTDKQKKRNTFTCSEVSLAWSVETNLIASYISAICGTKIYKVCPEIVCLFEMPIESRVLMRGWDINASIGLVIDVENKHHHRTAINPTAAVDSHPDVSWASRELGLHTSFSFTLPDQSPSILKGKFRLRKFLLVAGCNLRQCDSAAQQVTPDCLEIGGSQVWISAQHFKMGF